MALGALAKAVQCLGAGGRGGWLESKASTLELVLDWYRMVGGGPRKGKGGLKLDSEALSPH